MKGRFLLAVALCLATLCCATNRAEAQDGSRFTVTHEHSREGLKSKQVGDDEAANSLFAGSTTGACCFRDGTCDFITKSECNLQGGYFQGFSFDCSDVECLGACCLPGGGCSLGTRDECDAANGIWQGYGSDCDCVSCAVGACCLPAGGDGLRDCADLNRHACESQGGTYLGGGTSCGGPGRLCEVQVDDLRNQIGPINLNLPYVKFDDDSGAKNLLRVIVKERTGLSIVGWMENASELPINNGAMLLQLMTQRLAFPTEFPPGDQIEIILDDSFSHPAPPLAPFSAPPLSGPDFHHFGETFICHEEVRQVTSAADLPDYVGVGRPLTAAFFANGTIFFGAETDFTSAVENFFGEAEVRLAYIYEPLTGACCLCDGTCQDDLTAEECDAFAQNQTGLPPQSFTPDALCSEVGCEAIGACCLCDGTCTDGLTSAECDALALSQTGKPRQSWAACVACADVDCEPIGACCLCDGTCTDGLTSAECDALALSQTGKPRQSWAACTDCSEVGCEPIGACCLCDGTCTDGLTSAECDALALSQTGKPRQSWAACTNCSEVGCEPIGACCLCDGSCTDGLTSAECDALALSQTGKPRQSWAACTDCSEVTCEPVGACCLCNGSCTNNLTSAQCDALAQSQTGKPAQSWTACADCSEVSCEPIGACCLCDGCIGQTTQAECEADPKFQAFFACMDCSEITCETAGACCFCDGDVCEVLTPAECEAKGPDWRYLGDCVSCDACEPVGACCFPGSDECIDGVTEDACTSAGGDYFVACGHCDDDPPPCERGACCLSTGECVGDLRRDECEDDLGGVFFPGEDCADVICSLCRTTCEEKGSFFVVSKIEVRWDADGNLIQDTFVSLSNDYAGDVRVQMFFVNGDEPLPADDGERAHPGWNFVDNAIELTGNQSTWWAASDGSGVVSPWTVLDPGTPPGRPAMDGTTDRVLRGFIYGWATNAAGEEIRWNGLSGNAVLLYYPGGSAAWEYTICTFKVPEAVAPHGGVLPDPGVLRLDGTEYCAVFDQLLMNFQAVGSTAYSGGGETVISDTDVTLHPLGADFRLLVPADGPVTTKADYSVWNENEIKLSGAYRCITCWDQTLLSFYDTPNHFMLDSLQTDQGKARIDGIESALCPGSEPAAMLGLVARWLEFTGAPAGADIGASGVNMVGMGFQTAIVRHDAIDDGGGGPPEFPGGSMDRRSDSPFETIDRFLEALMREAGVTPTPGR